MTHNFISSIGNCVVQFIVPVAIVVMWDTLVVTDVLPSTLVARPMDVLRSFYNMSTSGELLLHTFISLKRLVAGLLIGSIFGFIAGITIGTSTFARKLFASTLQLLGPIPPIAWIPILIIIFGIGETSKIALIALATFFVIYLNTVQGIRAVDYKLIELANTYKKSQWQLIIQVLIPSAITQLFTGLRTALSLSWILLIASEVIASSSGLGWLIWNSRNFSRADEMIVGMIAIGLLGKATDSIVIALELQLSKWRIIYYGT